MKMFLAVALALVAAVAAGPVNLEEQYPILRSSNEQSPDGSFHSSFETGNGIAQEFVGELKQVTDEDNKPVSVLVLRGKYSYSGADGTPVSVDWVADETGFHAEGDSIPKPVSRR